ncbi:hypothetical protein E8P82_06570 [Arthrobacter echini]|uniref:GerMN domain-containing protein n=1 Tax=Arthrobacter echini TaxID=1529066 RepID=A0A4S5E6A0_9MICC|nr:GerMN domain-containing protein [Arthrobacter echini]THJ67095.1 hypothetical protein E8P82_06570 [Arthrobacter echini]
MNESDPLRRKRLGLGRILLVSGGVLVIGSVFVAPAMEVLGGDATTDLTAATTAPTTRLSAGPAAPAEGPGPSAPARGAPSLTPVYWLGEAAGRQVLFREFHPAPAEVSGDPIADAVHLMTSGSPLDPDYSSPWNPAASVTSSISTKNVITLDLSSDAFSEGLADDEARLAVQQLVFTATAAAANAGLIQGGESSSVVVLVDGAADYSAFGAVELHGEWTRDTSVLAPVWIIDPQEQVEAGTDGLIVHGLAPADQGEAQWRIARVPETPDGGQDGSSAYFRDGTTEIGTDDGAYSFFVDLPPGRYEIIVSVPSDGGMAADSKSVLIR